MDITKVLALKDVPQRINDAARILEVGFGDGQFLRSLSNAGYSVVGTEVSQWMLDEVREASRVKSQFLANVSHELRTPLNCIVNIPQPLLRDFEEAHIWHCESCQIDFQDDGTEEDGTEVPAEDLRCPECDARLEKQIQMICVGDGKEHVRFLREIEASGRQLLGVINDLLDFSKIEAGFLSLSIDEIDVEELLSRVRDTVGVLAEKKGIILQTDMSEAPPVFHGDSLRLAQILVNLVGNAIKFTSAGGQVIVAVRRDLSHNGRATRISVTDSGIGIPKEQLEIIFDSFTQVDGSHTRAHKGTGLGLAITKQLVELHGGRIWADSVPGESSVFTFIIPEPGDSSPGDG